jgi:hypothetical protein
MVNGGFHVREVDILHHGDVEAEFLEGRLHGKGVVDWIFEWRAGIGGITDDEGLFAANGDWLETPGLRWETRRTEERGGQCDIGTMCFQHMGEWRAQPDMPDFSENFHVKALDKILADAPEWPADAKPDSPPIWDLILDNMNDVPAEDDRHNRRSSYGISELLRCLGTIRLIYPFATARKPPRSQEWPPYVFLLT